MATTDLGLPLIDSTYAPDGPNQMNALANAVNTLLKRPWKTGTGTITVPAGTGSTQDLVVNFGVTFATTPRVHVWLRNTEPGFSVSSHGESTTQFTATAGNGGTLAVGHAVAFGWAVVDSPWANPYV